MRRCQLPRRLRALARRAIVRSRLPNRAQLLVREPMLTVDHSLELVIHGKVAQRPRRRRPVLLTAMMQEIDQRRDRTGIRNAVLQPIVLMARQVPQRPRCAGPALGLAVLQHLHQRRDAIGLRDPHLVAGVVRRQRPQRPRRTRCGRCGTTLPLAHQPAAT